MNATSEATGADEAAAAEEEASLVDRAKQMAAEIDVKAMADKAKDAASNIDVKALADKAKDTASNIDVKAMAGKAKDVAVEAKEKVTGFVGEHEGQIGDVIDKAGKFVDDKVTRGKFSDHIDKAQGVAKSAVGKVGNAGSAEEGAADKPESPGEETTS